MRFLLSTVVALSLLPCVAQQPAEDLVHTTVGTKHEGQTYPAAGVPFAMTHWTPQTRAGETKCIAPYYFDDAKIQGIRGSHFISGSCVPDYGSVTMMAGTGQLRTDAVNRASAFTHDSETSAPYEYRVTLADYDVKATATGTTRAGVVQFTFLKGAKQAWIVLENNSRGGDGFIRFDPSNRTLSGSNPVRREYAGSGKLSGFSGHFFAEVDTPPHEHGMWVGTETRPKEDLQTGYGKPVGVVRVAKMMTSTGGASAAAATQPTGSPRPGFGAYLLLRDVKPGQTVTVRIGTSFVSIDNARMNLRAEIPSWDYGRVLEAARSAWHNALTAVQLKTTAPTASIFYTSLYHALLHPRTYSDSNGDYPRFASADATESAKGFTYYDDFSMWDTFRAQHPLLTLIDPRRDADMMQSLVAKGTQGGFLPIFPAWNSYTSEMVGDHATVTLIDAWNKGIRPFDAEKAYALMRKNATEIPALRDDYIDGKGRRGLTAYLHYGYIPLQEHMVDAFHRDEQVSRTLEYAYDDAILSGFAAELGRRDDAALFRKHGENWRNVIDPVTGFATGRNEDGSWTKDADPARDQTWITEGLPWQYTFFVPQNVNGLIEVEHGQQAFVRKLDELFARGLYDHGNEPSHHIAYLYDAADAPSKTQQHVRALMESEYKDGPDGLAGNDDAGQMSAWYVMSALGLYQVAPGRPEYWIGSPRFDDMQLRLPAGKNLHILAPGAERGLVYVQQVTLNGQAVHGWKLTHRQLLAGGTLRFTMSETPGAQ